MEESISLIKAQTILSALIGQKAWGAKLGFGTFVTIEFGRRREEHGEWHLWLYDCDWTIEKHSISFLSSNDPRTKILEHIPKLNGLILKAFKIEKPFWNSVFEFSDGFTLKVLSYESVDSESFMFFIPDGRVVSFGPGSSITIEIA